MASIARVFVPPAAFDQPVIHIDAPPTLHYLLRVRRLSAGADVECFDGQGHVADGRILRASPEGIDVALGQRRRSPEGATRVTLAQALIKGERFEWVIEKATELGVAAVVPLVTRRTIVRPSEASAQRKVVRWQRIAQEAAKQCRRASVPHVSPPQSLAAYVAGLASETRVFIATLGSDTLALREALAMGQGGSDIALLVGPEGDFTPEEVVQAKTRGAAPVSLGALTLRSETAAIAMLAIVQCTLGAL